MCSLNKRGDVILPAICAKLERSSAVAAVARDGRVASGTIAPAAASFAEEDRSRQPSVFSLVRALVGFFGVDANVDPQLGLYGSFGYDLAFQFEPVKLKHARDPGQRDLLLYLPDSILVVDNPRFTIHFLLKFIICFLLKFIICFFLKFIIFQEGAEH